MPLQNYTAFTKVDPNSHISVAANTLTLTGITRQESAYVYVDEGANFFNFNFTSYFNFTVTSVTSNPVFVSWMLANDVGDQATLATNGKTFLVLQINPSGSLVSFYLREHSGGSYTATSNPLTNYNWSGVNFYCKIVLDTTVGAHGTLYCYVYSDAARTNLLGSSSITLTVTPSYRYLFGFSSYADGSAGNAFSGTVNNLDVSNLMGLVSTLVTSKNGLTGSCVDTTNKVLYFFPSSGISGYVVKIPLSTFTVAAVSATTVSMSGSGPVSPTYGYDGSGYIYFVHDSGLGWVKISDFSIGVNTDGGFAVPYVDSNIEFSTQGPTPPFSTTLFNNAISGAHIVYQISYAGTLYNQLFICGLDKKNKYLYACNTYTNLLYKYSYTSSTITQVATASAGGQTWYFGVIDTVNNFAYFMSYGGYIYKYDVSGNNLTYIASVATVSTEDPRSSKIDIDIPNGYIYTCGASVVKRLNLSTFSFDQAFSIPGSPAYAGGCSFDPNGYLYVSDGLSPSTIYKLQVTPDPPTYLPETKGNVGAGLKKPNNIYDFNRLMGGY